MDKLNLDTYMHVGIVVNSIEETLKKMETISVFQQPNIVDFPPKDRRTGLPQSSALSRSAAPRSSS